jgi:hypothetical protein
LHLAFRIFISGIIYLYLITMPKSTIKSIPGYP